MSEPNEKKTRRDCLSDQPIKITDHRPDHCTEDSSFDRRDEDLQSMYKLRNGRGEILQTPKRSSMTRAMELLTTPPTKVTPCRLTVTGADWPLAPVVRACPLYVASILK